MANFDLLQLAEFDSAHFERVHLIPLKLVCVVRFAQFAFTRVAVDAKNGQENIGVSAGACFISREHFHFIRHFYNRKFNII